MTAETATVEVLTAEVRVLMIGSRQVTLSVARQLDEVEPGDITPFGRVRTGLKLLPPDHDCVDPIEVIGECDGKLVRSCSWLDREFCDPHDPRQRCPRHPLDNPPPRRHDFRTDLDGVRDGWLELPLIVLAGLR